MCTVTIIPKGDNNFVLTSNRDEAPNRLSLPPDFYTENNSRLLYPKDELSGGTWIGISDKNRLICLLNGGYERHERQENYQKSRGIVTKDFMVAESIFNAVETYNFNGIEPFTMVIADWNSILGFYELVWDGTQKYFKRLPLEPKIWSSSTLYSEKMKQERMLWFTLFKFDNPLNAETLLQFHKTAGFGNKDYGVIMNRGFVKTTSITQVEKQDEILELCYENLQNNTIYNKTFQLSQVVNE